MLPLPQKPTDFSGAVGKLNIKAQLNKTDVKEGDPVNLRIVIAGVGNLKLMRQPTVTFPTVSTPTTLSYRTRHTSPPTA